MADEQAQVSAHIYMHWIAQSRAQPICSWTSIANVNGFAAIVSKSINWSPKIERLKRMQKGLTRIRTGVDRRRLKSEPIVITATL